MKVYLYDDGAGTMHAITNGGVRLVQHSSTEPFEQEDVLALRDAVKGFHPGDHQILWVADASAHPILSKILEREAHAEEELPTTTPGVHLCTGCAHEAVCVGKRAAETIGFTITTCTQHVALPTGEDHE